MKKSKLLKIIVPLGIIIFIVLALVFGNKQGNTVTEVVKTTAVVKEDIEAYVNSTGVVLSKDSVSVLPKQNGEIIAVYVKEGDSVNKGDLLAELDSSTLENQIRETEIQLEIAKETLVQIVNQGSNNYKSSYNNALLSKNTAYASYEDAKALFEAGVYSQKSVDDAYNAYKQALNTYDEMRSKYNNDAAASDIRIQELRIESYENNLAEQKKQLEQMKILAPIDGVVTDLEAKVLNIAMTGSPLFTIEDLDNLKVEINISQYDIYKISSGQHVTIKADGNDTMDFEGAVASIGSKAVTKVLRSSQEMVIEVDIDVLSENTGLKPNYSAKTEILTASAKDVLVLPYEALYVDKEGQLIVYTVRDGFAKAHIIEKGVESMLKFQVIASDIEEGDKIILNPTDKITDGLQVQEVGDL
jgi:HlyD family secretion protein